MTTTKSSRQVPIKGRAIVLANGNRPTAHEHLEDDAVGLRCLRVDPKTGNRIVFLIVAGVHSGKCHALASACPGDTVYVEGDAQAVDSEPLLLPRSALVSNPSIFLVVTRAPQPWH